jgi:hypothetical protein
VSKGIFFLDFNFDKEETKKKKEKMKGKVDTHRPSLEGLVYSTVVVE